METKLQTNTEDPRGPTSQLYQSGELGCVVVTNIPKSLWLKATQVYFSLIYLSSVGCLGIVCLLRDWGGEKLCLCAAMLTKAFVHWLMRPET